MRETRVSESPRVDLCSEERTHFWKQHPLFCVHKAKKGKNEMIDVDGKSRSYHFCYPISHC